MADWAWPIDEAITSKKFIPANLYNTPRFDSRDAMRSPYLSKYAHEKQKRV